MDTINLSNIAEGEFVSTTFSVSRDAGFDNTVDFYEVNSDGSVIDSVSGNIIAPGEAGYREAALANRVGLALRTENRTTSEFFAELEGGKQYAPLIAIESAIEPLRSNPVIYFTYSEANADGFDHVRNSSDNVFGFEDLVNGGDADFNDLVIDVSFNEVTPEPLVEPIPAPPTIQPAIEPVVESTPAPPAIESAIEPVVEPTPEPLTIEPAIEPPVVEPIPEPPAIESAIEPVVEPTPAPLTIEPAIEPPIVEPTPEPPTPEPPVVEPTTQPTIDGVAANSAPNSAEPRSIQPLDPTVENGEFSFDAEGAGTGFFSIVDVDFDLSAGVGSIAFDVNESTTGKDISSFEDIPEYRFVAPFGSGLPTFESVTLRDPGNTLGLESTDVSLFEDFISVNTDGIDFASGGAAVLDITFADGTPLVEPTPVEPTPEPPVVEPIPVEPIPAEPIPAEPVVQSTPVEPVSEPIAQPTIDGLAFTFVPGQAQSVEPLGTTVENGEFSFDAENAGIDFFSIFDVDFDLSAGVGSISFDVDELSTTGDEVFDFDDVLLYRFVSRPNSGLPAFESVTLRDSSNSLGLEPINIFFGEDFITVNTSAIDFATRGSAVLDIEFTEL